MTPRLRLIRRLFTIERTLVRHGLDEIVWRTHLLRPIAWLHRLRFWRRPPATGVGRRLRLALEELGPIFVKFGQAVSVRRDLLPREIADELAKLQDQVPPFDPELGVAQIERAFGRKLEDLFPVFEREPLAAASIAQVHAARLPSGESVVVKLLRPGVDAQIRRDLEVLFMLAQLAERYWDEAARLHPVEVVEEFERTLRNELDLMREAANAAQLKRNFESSDLLYVPEVYWPYCRTSVLTMERIEGIPISDIAALRGADVDIKRLAENGVEIFFTQVFRHNFFHADMHPGNIFVDATEPKRPRYVAVDFGIVGALSAEDQHYLAENFLAFFRRDYERVAALHVDSGWVPSDTRVDELAAAVRAVCEPIFNKPLKEISFGVVLLNLFATAREFEMEVQPQLVLLQKTLLAVEGLGRELYPDLDLWQTAYPHLARWARQRRDPRLLAKRLIERLPELGEELVRLPELLQRELAQRNRRARRDAAATVVPRERGRRAHRSRREARPERGHWPASVLLLSGVLWIGLDAAPAMLGWIAMVVGGVGLLVSALRR